MANQCTASSVVAVGCGDILTANDQPVLRTKTNHQIQYLKLGFQFWNAEIRVKQMKNVMEESWKLQFWLELKKNVNWIPVSRLVFGLLVFYTILITAWVGDDAHITLRQIWNMLNGHGITFNVDERVQAFTHPLWFIILSYVIMFTRELFLTTILFSMALSISAILILFKIEISHQREKLSVLSPIYALVFSWAFIDYSTSGLENSLSYFLVGILLYLLSIQKWEKHLKHIYLILALLVLNRADYGILFLPIALVLLPNARISGGIIKTVLPGSIILIVWFVFSTIYFGSPLPNTFYAKIISDYPNAEIFNNGKIYFQSIGMDIVSLIIIFTGIIMSILCLNRIFIALTIGQILYMSYIYFIGGDFMQGRFFALLVYLSMGKIVLSIAISNFWKNRLVFAPTLFFLLVVIHFGAYKELPFNSGTEYTSRKSVGYIFDERGYFYSRLGLMSTNRTNWPIIQDYSTEKPTMYKTTCGFVGAKSFHNTSYHLIDNCALTDQFLSRIPAVRSGNWRVGHHLRKIPKEYGEYLIGNINELPDKKLNKLLYDVNLVTSGNLFTLDRFAAIFRLNTNYHSNIDFSNYQDPDIFIPITDKVEEIYLDNWDMEIPYDNLPAVLSHIRYRKFNSNIKIVSKKTKVVKELYIALDLKFSYDIYVNNNKIGHLKYSENLDANEQNTTIKFDKPISVKSVTLKATDANYKIPGSITEFNFFHDFELR